MTPNSILFKTQSIIVVVFLFIPISPQSLFFPAGVNNIVTVRTSPITQTK